MSKLTRINKYATVITDVEVDVHLEDFDTEDLIEELELRGESLNTHYDVSLLELYELKRTNNPAFDEKFADYIYVKTGRIL